MDDRGYFSLQVTGFSIVPVSSHQNHFGTVSTHKNGIGPLVIFMSKTSGTLPND